MYCCISLRLSSAFLFFVPLLLLSSIIYSVALLQLSSTLLYTTTVTRQHFHTLHQFYSWAALPCWATVHSRSFCPFLGRQVVRAINGKLYFHTSNNQLRLCWDWGVLQKMNLIWELCCDCRNFYLSISQRQPSNIETVVWLFSWFWLLSISYRLKATKSK